MIINQLQAEISSLAANARSYLALKSQTEEIEHASIALSREKVIAIIQSIQALNEDSNSRTLN